MVVFYCILTVCITAVIIAGFVCDNRGQGFWIDLIESRNRYKIDKIIEQRKRLETQIELEKEMTKSLNS